MARNEIYVDAPPHAVYEVLAEPRLYSDWVVGSREIRAADRGWPAPGTAFDHSVGTPPLVIKDHTVVVSSRAPAMLELLARARPLPTARITLRLEPDGDGTRLTMVEDPANVLLSLLAGPLGHIAIRFRNRESLRRLKALVERGRPRAAARRGGPLPARARPPRSGRD